MALPTLSRDAVPAWAKTDLHLHRPRRTVFGRLRCEWCSERWGEFGCWSRESAARMFVLTASSAQLREAITSGRVSRADLRLRRRPRPIGAHRRCARPPSGLALQLAALDLSALDRSDADRSGHGRSIQVRGGVRA